MVALAGEVRRVADVVMARILGGVYPPGLRLPPETALATELACGRSTVREALRFLADQGLVRARRGSGVMVLDFRREGTPALLPEYVRLGRFDVAPHVLAAEMLRLRSVMAAEAVRLAARYATVAALDEARGYLRRGPSLEADPAEHVLNELEMYRALVVASGMWPAAWMVNVFWAPLREVHRMFAAALGPVKPGYQPMVERLFELIEQRDEQGSVSHVSGWFETVDRQLVRVIERLVSKSPAMQKEES